MKICGFLTRDINMVTIKEIAKICGVSPSTVSKVIKNYPTIPEETKEKVRKVIEETGYVPNFAASSLSSGEYHNIGILGFLNDKESPLSRPLFSHILASFQKEITANGYNLVFIDKQENGTKRSFLRDCEYKKVAGILLFGNLYDAQMQEVINSDIPKIGFDYEGENISSVYTKGGKALYEMTSYIISQGHKNIIFVTGDANSMTDKRIRGFTNAMKDHGLPLTDHSILHISYSHEAQAEEITEKIVKEYPETTAIIYPDDIAAIVGIHKLRELGKKVPKDISVAGFDGAIFSKYLTHPLATMSQDTHRIGVELARTLIEIIKSKSKERKVVELEAELVKGKTIAKI